MVFMFRKSKWNLFAYEVSPSSPNFIKMVFLRSLCIKLVPCSTIWKINALHRLSYFWFLPSGRNLEYQVSLRVSKPIFPGRDGTFSCSYWFILSAIFFLVLLSFLVNDWWWSETCHRVGNWCGSSSTDSWKRALVLPSAWKATLIQCTFVLLKLLHCQWNQEKYIYLLFAFVKHQSLLLSIIISHWNCSFMSNGQSSLHPPDLPGRARSQLNTRSLLSGANPSSTATSAPALQGEEVEILPATNDNHGGVIVEMKDPMDSRTFVFSLRASLEIWRQQVMKLWIINSQISFILTFCLGDLTWSTLWLA